MHDVRISRRLILTAAAGALLPAAGIGAAQPSVANIATIGEPGSLDPMPLTADILSEIDQHIFETLYIFDPNLNLVPLLASAMPQFSADGREYVIPLRTGVPFHDGSTMDLPMPPRRCSAGCGVSPRGRLAGASVSSVVAPDPATVRIVLKQPYAPLVALLSYPNGAAVVMPKRLATAPDPLTGFIGTGPYQLIEHKPDQFVRVGRFDRYVSPPGPPNGYAGRRQAIIQELRFLPVPNPTTRADGLLSGDYHFADLLTPESFARLQGRKDVHAGTVQPATWSTFIMNTKAGVLSDVRLRRAVQAAVVPQDMLAAAFGSYCKLEGSLFPEGTPYYDPATPGYNQHDPAKASALLKKAGYDGKPVRILVTTQYDYMFKIGQVAQANLEDAGFKVDLQVMDWATLLQKRQDPSLWEAFVASHSVVPDPSLITFINPTYPGWWDSPDKHAALDAFVTESDPAKRVAIWKRIQALFFSEAPTLKLGAFYLLYGSSTKLTDYTAGPWPAFWNARLA